MRARLENRVRQLGVAGAVRFLGYRNGDELVRLFKACETVCVPSRNEPFGIVVLEAWSAAKPVVVTQNGGPNEYVWHNVNGLKIFPHAGSVAWGLRTLFSNFEHARWMGRNGRRAVESRFTWDIVAAQTLAIYGVEHVQPAAPRPRALIEPEAAAPSPPRTEDRRIPVLVQARLSFSGNGASGPVVSECREALLRAGLKPQLGRRSAIVSGDWETVAAAVRTCYQLVDRMGGARLTTSVKLQSQVAAEAEAEADMAALAGELVTSGATRMPIVSVPGPVVENARENLQQGLTLDAPGNA
jgi:uncharacterized protein YqgV (UPF0045/DUF77 family)